MPRRCSMTLSASTKSTRRRRASWRPTVDLPPPGKPIRLISTLASVRQVAGVDAERADDAGRRHGGAGEVARCAADGEHRGLARFRARHEGLRLELDLDP